MFSAMVIVILKPIKAIFFKLILKHVFDLQLTIINIHAHIYKPKHSKKYQNLGISRFVSIFA